MTDYAKRLAINKLSALADQGHDVKAVLEQSIFNSWQGLFPIRKEGVGHAPRSHSQQSQRGRIPNPVMPLSGDGSSRLRNYAEKN